MAVGRYSIILYLQYFLLFIDLFMNSFTEILRFQNVILLVLYVIQDFCIIFDVIIIFLQFFNTFIFQAGLVSILVKKFRLAIIVTVIYFGLCLGLHIWGMTLRWADPYAYIWQPGYTALFVFQRTAGVFYYYFYKRTALRLSDPKFYEDSEWIRNEFEKRR